METLSLSQFYLFLSSVFILIISTDALKLDGTSNSHVSLSPVKICGSTKISLQFKTRYPSGLLLYQDDRGHNSFLELKLTFGRLYLRLKLSDGEATIFSLGDNLNDGSWHKVTIQRSNDTTQLILDLQYRKRRTGNHPFLSTGVKSSNLYVGGLPISYYSNLDKLTIPTVYFDTRYSGLIHNISFINCTSVSNATLVAHDGIRLTSNDDCSSNNPCQNGGRCLSTDQGTACDCSRTLYDGPICTEGREVTIATFTGSDFLSYNVSSRGASIDSKRETLHLNFKTSSAEALLFYAGDDTSGTYMNIGIHDGLVYISVQMGDGMLSESLGMGRRFDDDNWHEVVLEREVRELIHPRSLCSLYVSVDGMYEISRSFNGAVSQIVSTVLYVGGCVSVRDLPGSKATQNFFGCLKGVQYAADTVLLNLLTMAKDGSVLLLQHGQLLFDECTQVQQIEPVTVTQTQSYLTLPQLSQNKSKYISLTFNTYQEMALILYTSGQKTDIFALEVYGGYLYIILDKDSSVMRQQLGEMKVNDGQPHHVSISFQNWGASVNLNKIPKSVTLQNINKLEPTSSTYLSGLNFTSIQQHIHPAVYSAVHRAGFTGCLSDVKIDGAVQNLKLLARKQEVLTQDGCQMSALDVIEDIITSPIVAKFDGSSHFSVNPRNTMKTLSDNIEFEFRTLRSSGSLLSARSKDTSSGIEIYLHNTKLIAKIIIKSIELPMITSQGLNDDTWHKVALVRTGVKVELRLDDQLPVQAEIPGVSATDVWQQVLSMDEIKLALPIGGTLSAGEDYSEGIDNNRVPFTGYMRGFIYNSVQHFLNAYKGEASEISFTCDFSESPLKPQRIVSIGSSQTYVTLSSPNDKNILSIYVQFKTSQQNGLIVYAQGMGGDYLAVELVKGAIQYVYSIAGARGMIRSHSNENLNDQTWHSLNIRRFDNGDMYLLLDGVEYVSTLTQQGVEWQLSSPFYISGVPSFARLPGTIISVIGFSGCLASLDINGRQIDIMNYRLSDNERIVRGCLNNAAGEECSASSCNNNGLCYQTWPTISCKCGMTSFTGNKCSEEGTSYQFGQRGGGLIKYKFTQPYMDKTSNKLAFGLITSQSDNTIINIQSYNSDDFLQVNMKDGRLLLQYDIGSGVHVLRHDGRRLNDGIYHIISLTRSGANITFKIDDDRPNSFYPTDSLSVFDSISTVTLGGRLTRRRSIHSSFVGVLSGFMLDHVYLLELAKSNHERITILGDVALTTVSKYDMMATDPGSSQPVVENTSDELIILTTERQPCNPLSNCNHDTGEIIQPKILETAVLSETIKATKVPVIALPAGLTTDILLKSTPVLKTTSTYNTEDVVSTVSIPDGYPEQVETDTNTPGAFDLQKNIPLIAGICGAAIITIVLIGVIICRLSKSNHSDEDEKVSPTMNNLPGPNSTIDDDLCNDISGRRLPSSPLHNQSLGEGQRRSDGKEWYV